MKRNIQLLNNNHTSVLGTTLPKPKSPEYENATKRKDSYKNWPEYLPLKPDVLVEAGLHYTGVSDSVRCYYCDGGLINWKRDDDPWEEHATWYPNCPHVLLVKGQKYVDRVRNREKQDMDGLKAEVAETPETDLNLLDTDAARACIENGYQTEQVKEAVAIYMAKSGGRTDFNGQDLFEILFELQTEEEEGKTTEAPIFQNVKLFERGGIVAPSGIVQRNPQFLSNSQTTNLGIIQQPMYPQYADATRRRESYENWPGYLPVKPGDLAEAGLVCTGTYDSVCCFHCGGGLRSWEQGDNPWEEHAKWYPSCPYVHLVKGQEYVDRVQKARKPDGLHADVAETPASGSDLLYTDAAQACIEYGYKKEQVKEAIDIYLANSGGKADFHGRDLCKIILEREEETARKETATSKNAQLLEGDLPFNNSGNSLLSKLDKRKKDGKSNAVCLPCGHMVSCPQCSPSVD